MTKFNLASVVALRSKLLLLASLILVACGGAGSSSSNEQPTPLSSQLVKEVFVSDKVLEPVGIIRSQGEGLYVGTEFGLVEIDSTTGKKRTVSGNTFSTDFSPSGQTPLMYVSNILIDHNLAYVPIRPYLVAQVAKVSISPQLIAPEIIVPRAGMDVTNFSGFATSAGKTFWLTFNGGGTTMNLLSQDDGIAESNRKLATITGTDGGMVARGDYLYLYTDNTGTPNRFVYRYQISTDYLQLVAEQPRYYNSYNLNFPLTASSEGVYWAAGGNIYFLANSSSTVYQIGNVAGLVRQLALSGPYLYTAAIDSASANAIVTQFDSQTWVGTEMFRVSNTVEFAIAGTGTGRTFWAQHNTSGTELYEISPTGTLTELAYPDSSQFFGVASMYASESTVAVSNRSSILRYSLTSGATDILNPVVPAYYMQGVGESISWADYGVNAGIMQFQLDAPVNYPVSLQAGVGAINPWSRGGIVSARKIYWIGYEFPTTGEVYRITSSLLDGTNYSVLVTTSGELRDPIVFNDRIYYLCKDSCGAPGWVLASSNLDGSDQKVSTTISGDDPRFYEFNGHHYLTFNEGIASTILALDISSQSFSILVDQIPYTTLSLDFSAKWLYWAGESVNPNGTPNREISRQAWGNWDQVDVAQPIERESGAVGNNNLRVHTIHSFKGFLYYWNAGLMRVSE